MEAGVHILCLWAGEDNSLMTGERSAGGISGKLDWVAYRNLS